MRTPTIMSAAVAGTTFRPITTYTTLRDVTWAAAITADLPPAALSLSR
jgi:hypothetical protein